jgi:hypothetical protein
MKTRTEKVADIFRKKNTFELAFKKKLKSIKPEHLTQELLNYNSSKEEFFEKYALVKGNYMRDIDYLKQLENTILLRTKEFNTYKLEVLYDFEEMNQDTYDAYEKEINDLKQKRDRAIIQNKKKIMERNERINQIKNEIKNVMIQMNDADTIDEKKILYKEIIQYKKEIFEITEKYLEIIPVITDSYNYSTLIIDYNPIKENEKDLDKLELNLGKNVELEELEQLE